MMVIKGTYNIKDGLYVVKDGTFFKYKSKGGTVHTYPIKSQVYCKDCKYLELKDFIHGSCKYRTGVLQPDGFCDKGEKDE